MHRFHCRIYYEDTDAGGIVYHANYLKFAERARTEWLRELDLHQSELKESQQVFFVVRHAEIDYFASARLDDLLEVQTRLSSLKNTSLTLCQDIYRDDARIAAIQVVIVCLNLEGRPVRIPEMIRANLSAQSSESKIQ